MYFNIKIKFGFNFGEGPNWLMLTKFGTKLNKNNKYRDQIEYRILNLTRGHLKNK